MEDRYLLKAKTCNGEWVTGFLHCKDNKWYISNKAGSPFAYEVYPFTICRCTGLKDKNGKLIWENDIVKINNSKMNTLITFRDFEIICTIPSEKYYKHRLEYDTEYEVIGNIFDNKELLESEENMAKKKGTGVSPITNRIYYGTQDTEKHMWVGQKDDITDNAIASVFEWFIGNMDGKEEYSITYQSTEFELVMRRKIGK